MGKGWSILFGVVLLAAFALFAIAPFIPGWWLPPDLSHYQADDQLSGYGRGVDDLFYLILAFTTFFFILTEALLVWFMWKYAYDPGRKAVYSHGNTRLEIFWTVVPAVLLIFIAVVQINVWERIKYLGRMPTPDLVIQVSGKQWEWRVRQGGPTNLVPPNPRDWAESSQPDDIYLVNEIHTWKGARVKTYLKTQDIIHSFFLPNLRLKQDALPGKTMPLWFTPGFSNMEFDAATGRWILDEKMGSYELACAELCGSRHYAMRGRLCVHPDEADYRKWLAEALKRQRATIPDGKPGLTNIADVAPRSDEDD